MTDVCRSRREFLTTASAAAAATLFSPANAAPQSQTARSTIGCHTRPFSRFRLDHDQLLDAIKEAGFTSADMLRATAPVAPSAGGAGARGQRGREIGSASWRR